MPLDDGRLLYTEMLEKYAPDQDWRTMYDAFIDHKMEAQDAVDFGQHYLVNEKMLAIAILRLVNKL